LVREGRADTAWIQPTWVVSSPTNYHGMVCPKAPAFVRVATSSRTVNRKSISAEIGRGSIVLQVARVRPKGDP